MSTPKFDVKAAWAIINDREHEVTDRIRNLEALLKYISENPVKTFDFFSEHARELGNHIYNIWHDYFMIVPQYIKNLTSDAWGLPYAGGSAMEKEMIGMEDRWPALKELHQYVDGLKDEDGQKLKVTKENYPAEHEKLKNLAATKRLEGESEGFAIRADAMRKKMKAMQALLPLLEVHNKYKVVLDKRVARAEERARLKAKISMMLSSKHPDREPDDDTHPDRIFQNDLLIKISEEAMKKIQAGEMKPEEAAKIVRGLLWLLKKQLQKPEQRGFFGRLGIVVTSEFEKQLDIQLLALNVNPNDYNQEEVQACAGIIKGLKPSELDVAAAYLENFKKMIDDLSQDHSLKRKAKK